MLSIIDLITDQLRSKISSSFISGPQILMVMRVLRVSRLFKLMKAEKLKGIQKIIDILIFSFPSLMNVTLLLFLIYFIASMLAVNLFQNLPPIDRWNDDSVNFRNFHKAFVTLFRCSTGADWYMFMYVYETQGISKFVSRSFFITYTFISLIVMLNIFQLVVMQQFDQFFLSDDSALNHFNEAKEKFTATWNLFTFKEEGKKIKGTKMLRFFKVLA